MSTGDIPSLRLHKESEETTLKVEKYIAKHVGVGASVGDNVNSTPANRQNICEREQLYEDGISLTAGQSMEYTQKLISMRG